MPDRLRRGGLSALVALGLPFAAHAETGWATSPVVALASPGYSVYGPRPGCGGAVLVDGAVRRVLDGIGRRGTEPDAPSRASRAVGDVLNLFGLDAVLQDHAVCADVCALVPRDARRVLGVVAYVDDGPGTPFRASPFDLWGEYVYWEPELDTTRVGDDGRSVCARVRHYLHGVERRAFLVVQYER